ncbi:hypothetical protein BASA83_013594 [Batrachochytrium salamandrivorans]|nr:hypothetical protein BASA83_013594 [Batrachochytrium salamandrivorans]
MFQILIQTSLIPVLLSLRSSSLRNSYSPGTLRIGPFSHVGTFFVDCGADDVFMDSKLAEELKNQWSLAFRMLRLWRRCNSWPSIYVDLGFYSFPDVYPFLDASPDSNSSVPADIFKEFTSVFSKKQSEKLPIHREFDARSTLSQMLLPIMTNYGSAWTTGDFNKNTIKDRNPIPLISEMPPDSLYWKDLHYFGLARSLQSSANQGGDEPKTAFITKFDWKIRLSLLGHIVVYSENLEKHKEHVKSVLAILTEWPLLQIEKFHFYQQESAILGMRSPRTSFVMDSAKVKALQDWPTPRKLRDIQVLLGSQTFKSDAYSQTIPHDVAT